MTIIQQNLDVLNLILVINSHHKNQLQAPKSIQSCRYIKKLTNIILSFVIVQNEIAHNMQHCPNLSKLPELTSKYSNLNNKLLFKLFTNMSYNMYLFQLIVLNELR